MTFNRQLALYCAKAIERLYAGDIAPNIIALQTDTQVLVEKVTDGRFAVIFPGSASRADWLTNSKVAFKAKWGMAKVHRGFGLAYDSVHAGILELLPPGAKLVIAGHSLGGALATLAADLLSGQFQVTDVFTFGSPRVGNPDFALFYNSRLGSRTARVVNSGDPVPHVPWWFGTYRHVDTQVYLRDDGTVQIAEPMDVAAQELTQTISTAFAVKNNPTAALMLAEPHHIQSYRRKLEQLK